MPPLRSTESYQPAETSEENEMYKLSKLECAIAMSMGKLTLWAEKEFLERTSLFRRPKPIVSPVVHYSLPELEAGQQVVAWIERSQNSKNSLTFDHTLYTQVVREDADGNGLLVGFERPEARVTSDTSAVPRLTVHGVETDMLPFEERMRLATDIAEVVDLIRIASYPGIDQEAGWTPLAQSIE